MGCFECQKNTRKESKIKNDKIQPNNEEIQKLGIEKTIIKCIYEIKDYTETQIINITNEIIDSKDIEAKIKIWHNNQLGELNPQRKFNQLGFNTIYFIVKEQLYNLSCLFKDCSSLKHVQFIGR